MKIQASIILSFLILGGLTSCDILGRFKPEASNYEIQRQYQAVSILLTQTAQATLRAVSSPISQAVLQATSTPTAPPSFTPTNIPTVSINRTSTRAPLSALNRFATPTLPPTPSASPADAVKVQGIPCELAQPGRPIDITVPDDSSFYPGEYFSKTWRLVNAGTCLWTRDYALVWFSGTEMGLNRAQSLNTEVKPGSTVDLTVEMVAPQTPGTYQSNWKMRNKEGELFGIGPNGDAPFWVRIVVVPADTPAATLPLPSATPAAAIFSSGTLTVKVGEGVDLDSGQVNQPGEDDIAFQRAADGQVSLAPLNGTRLMLVGINPPEMADCYMGGPSDAPVSLAQYEVGFYLCYRTTKGLPGRLTIPKVDLESGQFGLKFITWAAP